MLENTELANAVVDLNNGIPHGEGREEPLVVVTTIAFVHDTAMVGLNHTEVLKGTA